LAVYIIVSTMHSHTNIKKVNFRFMNSTEYFKIIKVFIFYNVFSSIITFAHPHSL